MRGTTSDSPSRIARLSAFASIASKSATEARTETPERWLTSGERRARRVISATISFMNAGTMTV